MVEVLHTVFTYSAPFIGIQVVVLIVQTVRALCRLAWNALTERLRARRLTCFVGRQVLVGLPGGWRRIPTGRIRALRR
jgi:hypothetical protein